MDFETKETYDIVPEFGGNTKSDKPAIVHCRYMTAPERDRAIKEELLTSGDGVNVRVVVDRPVLFKASVTGFTDLKIQGIEIKTIAQFSEARIPSGFYDECINKMIAENRRADLKN